MGLNLLPVCTTREYFAAQIADPVSPMLSTGFPSLVCIPMNWHGLYIPASAPNWLISGKIICTFRFPLSNFNFQQFSSVWLPPQRVHFEFATCT